MKILRGGKPLSLALMTAEEPAPAGAPVDEDDSSAPRDPGADEWEGAAISAVSPALAERYHFPGDFRGVIVGTVASGGLAEAAGLAEGDVVRSVNGFPTPDPESFLAAVKKAGADGFVLDVFRRGRWIYLTYKSE
jgi:membrane-associated protease RseP (regulator of RpoE activity)